MNIHEYQAKELLAKFGVAVPAGYAAMSVDEAVAAARTSSTVFASRTPPLASGGSSLNLPLPRPPAWICALTT